MVYSGQKGCKSCSLCPWPPYLWTFYHPLLFFKALSHVFQSLWNSILHINPSVVLWMTERDKDQKKKGRHGTCGYNFSVSWVLHLDIQQILFPPQMSSIDSLRFVVFWSLSSSKPSFYFSLLVLLASSSSFHTCSYQRLSLFIISALYLYGLRGLCYPKGISWCHFI